MFIFTLCASCSAVYCNRSCLFVCGCAGGSVTMITRNCVHRSSPNWVSTSRKGSDHLQRTKFWPSRAPGKRICGGVKFFGSALLQPACSVCISSERFFHQLIFTTDSRVQMGGPAAPSVIIVSTPLSLSPPPPYWKTHCPSRSAHCQPS